MKKSILVLALLVVSLVSFGQDAVKGIGKFKIMETHISIIDSLAQVIGKPFKTYYKNPDVYSTNYAFLELKVDTLNPYSSHHMATEFPNVRLFYIKSLKIANIEVKNIYIKFFEGILIEIKCESRQLYEAIESKYPNFSTDKEEKETTCVIGGSNDARFAKNVTYYKKWDSEYVHANITSSFNYDSDCRKYSFDYLLIYSKEHNDVEFLKYDLKLRQERENNKNKSKYNLRDL